MGAAEVNIGAEVSVSERSFNGELGTVPQMEPTSMRIIEKVGLWSIFSRPKNDSTSLQNRRKRQLRSKTDIAVIL